MGETALCSKFFFLNSDAKTEEGKKKLLHKGYLADEEEKALTKKRFFMGTSLSCPSGAGPGAFRNQPQFPSSSLVKLVVASNDDAAILRVRRGLKERKVIDGIAKSSSSITAASDLFLFFFLERSSSPLPPLLFPLTLRQQLHTSLSPGPREDARARVQDRRLRARARADRHPRGGG